MKCHGFSYLYIAAACMAALLFLPGCKSAKLSDANEAFDRGEYFDAQKIYRKVYNRLTKREDRPLRGEVAFKLGQCYTKLNRAPQAAAAYQNALRYEYPDSSAYPRASCP